MIIWSGLGFLVVVFVFVFGFFFYDKGTWMSSNAPLAYTLLLAGLASGILGGLLNKYGGKTFIDKATGKQVTFRRSHSLFFIPIFFWGPILIVCGIYLLIKKP
jgi:hypothetical protein